jgi:membrane protease YdiL (CAAX protease family)
MAVSDLSETEATPKVLSFRDVPWRWSDVAIGFAPIVLALLVRPSISRTLPRWIWIPLTFLQLAWMFAFPLWLAGRRRGIPGLSRIRSVLIEASITVLAAPLAMFVAAVLATLVTNFLTKSESSHPFEAIAGSEDRYDGIALAILAVAVAPLGEEFLFRGLLYNFLCQRIHFLVAALLSGIMFGFYHPFGLAERMAISTIGVLVALLYEWRKTLISPILMHTIVNAIGMCFLFWLFGRIRGCLN